VRSRGLVVRRRSRTIWRSFARCSTRRRIVPGQPGLVCSGVHGRGAQPAVLVGVELSPLDDPEVPVHAIGVERDYRGRGVGGLLIDALIAEARASGVTAITLTTGLFNDAAVRRYRRRGFAEPFHRGDGVQMRLALD